MIEQDYKQFNDTHFYPFTNIKVPNELNKDIFFNVIFVLQKLCLMLWY